MSFTVNLKLIGLHALVPGAAVRRSRLGLRRMAEEHRIPRLRILIPDARRPAEVPIRVGDAEHQMHVCAHDPFMLVEQPEGPDLRLQLDGHQIELDSGGRGEGLMLRPSFGSIAELASAVAESVQVDSRLLDQPDERLVGRLALDTGTVSGSGASELLYDFRNPQKEYLAYLHRGTRIAVPVAAERAELRLVPFAGGAPQIVELKPKAGTFAVDVIVSNLCEEREGAAPEPDADFARYYDLLADYGAGPRFVPFPVLPPGEVLALATRVTSGCIGTVMPDSDV